jgi:hypothetical protein
VRFLDAQGQRRSRTFDTAQDALDFRGRLRLLKRAGDLAALDIGRESLAQFSRDYWRLYVEVRLTPRTREDVSLPVEQAHPGAARRVAAAP